MFDVMTKTHLFDVYQTFNWNNFEENSRRFEKKET